MPEWLFGGLITLGALVGAGGLVIGYVLNARTARTTAEATTTAATATAAAAAEAAERTDSQQLIDQLQEELRTHRAAQDARATEFACGENLHGSFLGGWMWHSVVVTLPPIGAGHHREQALRAVRRGARENIEIRNFVCQNHDARAREVLVQGGSLRRGRSGGYPLLTRYFDRRILPNGNRSRLLGSASIPTFRPI